MDRIYPGSHFLSCLLALTGFLCVSPFLGQTATPAALSGARLTAGGLFSAFRPGYGSNALYGAGGFLDLNVRQHLGLEGEVRFLRLGQAYDVYEDNYALGLRYRRQFRRYEPYGKFLVGNGQFNFPFSYAHGGYLMLIPGGGLDIHWHRFTIRAVDYEYQRWLRFQYGSLDPNGISTGIGYRLF